MTDLSLAVSGTGIEAVRAESRQSLRSTRSNSSGSLSRGSSKYIAQSPSNSFSGKFSLLDMDAEMPGMIERAKEWTPEVEDLYRLQICGWRDIAEYTAAYGAPERWPSNEAGHRFISKVQLKANGYFTYWRKFRQCEDRHIFKVRVFAPSS
mmetsp:Transcript_84168/g.146169  ORF Transcript_84168/g.146169 Transcript_84168/m.146169 type:complete len:151 (-) Transcript_84168:92-544(-)